MDKFVKITKANQSGKTTKEKDKQSVRYNPYGTRGAEGEQARQDWIALGKEQRMSARSRRGQNNEQDSEQSQTPASSNAAAAMKHVMTTLKHPGNPLTSRAGLSHVDHVWSCATGHQQSDTPRGMTAYHKERNARIDAQRDPAKSSLFSGCRIYCNSGYCANTTDLELKRLVKEYGGVVAMSDAGATHILTSMSLSAAKIDKFLKTRAKVKKHIVKPEWLFDSIELGKRKAEWGYTVIKESTQPSLVLSNQASSST